MDLSRTKPWKLAVALVVLFAAVSLVTSAIVAKAGVSGNKLRLRAGEVVCEIGWFGVSGERLELDIVKQGFEPERWLVHLIEEPTGVVVADNTGRISDHSLEFPGTNGLATVFRQDDGEVIAYAKWREDATPPGPPEFFSVSLYAWRSEDPRASITMHPEKQFYIELFDSQGLNWRRWNGSSHSVSLEGADGLRIADEPGQPFWFNSSWWDYGEEYQIGLSRNFGEWTIYAEGLQIADNLGRMSVDQANFQGSGEATVWRPDGTPVCYLKWDDVHRVVIPLVYN